MKPLMQALGPLLERLKALTLKQRFALITAVLLVVGVGLWVWAAALAVKYGVLFSNLEQADASQIIEKLRENKVLYKLERGGTEILVAEDSVHETRLQLAGEGLPSGGGVGFELFDEQRFGESEFSEQVKYHRALEGELSRTITHLAGVESARVHLVLPSRSLFASSDNAASASVALRLKAGARLSRDQTRGIVNLVASSVRGLTPEGVTIVDGSGRRLAGGDSDSETVTNSLEFQRNYERSLSRDLQQILDTAVGMNQTVVRVAADVTFAREEVVEERIDPNSTASRSFQIVEEHDNSQGGVTSGGVPGAVSTLEGSDPSLAGKTAGAGLVRRSETRNYEISKIVRKTSEPVGRVTRISLAVAVDGHWKGKGDKRVFTARTPQELATIKTLLVSAAGIKETRGDQIAVECVPFADAQTPDAAPAELKGLEAVVKKNLPYAVVAGGVLALLLVGAIMFTLLRKGGKPIVPDLQLPGGGINVELAKVTPGVAGVTVEANDVAAATLGELAAARETLPVPETKSLSEDSQAEAERLRALTSEIASGDPYLAARVIRTWLRESSESGTSQNSGSEAAA